MPFGYGQFAQDLQEIHNSLVYLDSLALNDRYQEHVRVSKALTLVWMAAEVERFWKAYLTELCARVSASSLHKRRRHIASAAIYYFDALGSLGDGKKLKRWGRAADLLEAIAGQSSQGATIPYDGRTVRPEHVSLAWRLFSLPGGDFPSPIHRQDLNTLADQRNDIAHGIVDPAFIGGTVSVGDLRTRVRRLEDFAEHCVLAADRHWS